MHRIQVVAEFVKFFFLKMGVLCSRQDALLTTMPPSNANFVVEAKSTQTYAEYTISDLQVERIIVSDEKLQTFIVSKCVRNNIYLITDNLWRTSPGNKFIYRTLPVVLTHLFPRDISAIVYAYSADDSMGEYIGKENRVDMDILIFGNSLHNRIVAALMSWLRSTVQCNIFDPLAGHLRTLSLAHINVRYSQTLFVFYYSAHSVYVQVQLCFEDGYTCDFGSFSVQSHNTLENPNILITYHQPPSRNGLAITMSADLCEVIGISPIPHSHPIEAWADPALGID